MRIIFLNGEFLPIEKAHISPMDRGFLFADGIYEVSAVYNGKLVDNDGHLKRLQRSLSELKIKLPMSLEEIEKNQLELIKQNNLTEGLIYLQVTRGVQERDFNYSDELTPTFMMFTQSKKIVDSDNARNGVKVVTVSDIRWTRRDIKSIALLPQVMAKNEARAQGAFEAFMVDEKGFITEGSSSNVYIIKNKTIITRNLSNNILHGITRASVLRLAKENSLKIDERPFSVDEALNADESFLTSATNFVLGVVEINGKKLGDGRVGEMTLKLSEIYLNSIR